jgi:peptide subunit release factor 1 (eRF1)
VISRQQLAQVEERVLGFGRPVLSLYAHVNPGSGNNHPKAVALRARDTLRKLAVSDSVTRRVLEYLEAGGHHGRTAVIFATEQDFEVVDLSVDLPVVSASGQVDARWGAPYITPLLLAMDEWERYGVLYVDSERWRLFEVFLGEISEIGDARRSELPGVGDDLSPAKQVHPAYVAARGGSIHDDIDGRTDAWIHRFFKSAAQALENAMKARGMGRLILIGTREETRLFENTLPKHVRDKVVANEPSLPHPNASAGEVLERVRSAVQRAEAAAEQKLLTQIRERGVAGLEKTLSDLQTGRLYVLAVPWTVDRDVTVDPNTGYVSPVADGVNLPSDGPAERRTLRQVLPDLAAAHGVRLEFMQGESERRLLTEFGGLAGLARY